MESDWLGKYDVTIDEIRRVVDAACRGSNMRHADDIFAEALLKLTRIHRETPDKCPDKSRLLKYSQVIAAHEVIRQARKAGRQRSLNPEFLADLAGETTGAAELPSRQQVLEALADAAPEVREVLGLHLEGIKGNVIAARLGISPPTVSRHLSQGKAILRRKFADLLAPSK